MRPPLVPESLRDTLAGRIAAIEPLLPYLRRKPRVDTDSSDRRFLPLFWQPSVNQLTPLLICQRAELSWLTQLHPIGGIGARPGGKFASGADDGEEADVHIA